MTAWAYPQTPSVTAGETLTVRVSSRGPFRLLLYRLGSATQFLTASPVYGAFEAPSGRVALPWDAAACDVPIPRDARPGAYAAFVAHAPADVALPQDRRDGAALFVVRPPHPRARVLVNLPLFTYHAYNSSTRDPLGDETRGHSLCTGASAVTLLRPGGGIGGHLCDEADRDAYDLASPRHCFEHWDRKALAWLEERGYDVDVATDWDLHAAPYPLAGYRLLLCFGHHAYWTDRMRARVERFVDGGGNVAFFGANALWSRVRYDVVRATIERAGAWPVREDRLTGASYRFGGGRDRGARPPVPYVVSAPDHWAFAGCDFSEGSAFGASGGLIGYRCDGAPPDPGASARELARADLDRWRESNGSEVFPDGHASFVVREGAGTVVHAGTVDWPRLLARDAAVARITRNVIERLAAGDVASSLVRNGHLDDGLVPVRRAGFET
jgi:hypothetical protein